MISATEYKILWISVYILSKPGFYYPQNLLFIPGLKKIPSFIGYFHKVITKLLSKKSSCIGKAVKRQKKRVSCINKLKLHLSRDPTFKGKTAIFKKIYIKYIYLQAYAFKIQFSDHIS